MYKNKNNVEQTYAYTCIVGFEVLTQHIDHESLERVCLAICKTFIHIAFCFVFILAEKRKSEQWKKNLNKRNFQNF